MNHMKMMMKVILVLALTAFPAYAQDKPYCEESTDDTVCTFQRSMNLPLTTTGAVDNATCDAVVGYPTYDRFFNTVDVENPDPVDVDVFMACYSWGKYDFAKPTGSTAVALTFEQMLVGVRAAVDTSEANRKAAEAAAEAARQADAKLHADIFEKLGAWVGTVDWVVLAGTVGTISDGVTGGGTLRLHVPVGPYRSGIEFGIIAGYSGLDQEVRRVHFLGQVGPVIEGVFMPRSWLGFTLGAELAYLLPAEAMGPGKFVGARTGVRFSFTRWLFVQPSLRAGWLSNDDGNFKATGGAEFMAGLHF